jgi:hypothetical protein
MSSGQVTVLRVDDVLAEELDNARERIRVREGVVITRAAIAAAAIRLGLVELRKNASAVEKVRKAASK